MGTPAQISSHRTDICSSQSDRRIRATQRRVINPRRACAARVTVLGSVCLSVCLLSHISCTERLFVLKTLSRTQRATKVKKFVGICLKLLRSRVMPRNMSEKANMLIIPTYPQSAFSA